MLLDHRGSDFITGEQGDLPIVHNSAPRSPRWTVVLPFYNERDFLPASLRSLATQSMPFRLVLVDNGSTDGGGRIAMDLCNRLGLAATLLHESRPGKVSALQSGVGGVATEFIATCDADTIYPHDYLARAAALLDGVGVVAAIAATAPPGATRFSRKMAGLHMAIASRLLPQQCLNGGAGQVFRTDTLKAAGSFDPLIWNWVLEDHEIMARVERHGRIAYDRDFFCAPITRPRLTNTVGWCQIERLRYHATRPANRQAFFHDFLGPRLHERALTSDRLRRETRQSEEAPGIADLYPLRG